MNRGDVNAFDLYDFGDLEPSTGGLLRRMAWVKRIVVELVPQMAAINGDTNSKHFMFSLPWMLLVADADDTDLTTRSAVFGSTQHTLIQSSRVLQVGLCNFNVMPWNGGSAGDFDGRFMTYERIRIDWRGTVKLNPDEQLLLLTGCDYSNAVSASDDGYVDDRWNATMTGWTRVLLKHQ